MIRHTLPRAAYNKWTEVDLNALCHNLNCLRQACASEQVRIMGVVKANAYGHNLSLIAPALWAAGVRHFGVATLSEALYLRELCPEAEMILILGAQTPAQSQALIDTGFDFLLHSLAQLPALAEQVQRSTQPAYLHLKVDTGMGRVGLPPEAVPAALEVLANTPQLHLRGICSHLATSDLPPSENPYLQAQLRCFEAVRQLFLDHPLAQRCQPLFHLANSDAVLQYPETHFDMVRPGIALYGYSGSPDPPLKPVLSLKSHITQFKQVAAGQSLGYGCTFVTRRPSQLGVLGIGYADGVARLLSNQQEVLVAGQRAPIVGRISMDQLVIDLTELQLSDTAPEVVLIGHSGPEQISAQDWASTLQTIPYEILTSLGTRLPRYPVTCHDT